MEFVTNNPQETQRAAADLVKRLGERTHQGALILALQGELGAGKTTFIQGLAEALGIKEKVLSPTFVIMRRFAMDSSGFENLYHLDAYRLSSAEDLKELGLENILKDKKNLVVIEWAERVKDILPADTVWLKFEHGGGDKRRIIFEFCNF